MASPNPDGPPYRPYRYGLKRPQTRRANTLAGSLSNAAGPSCAAPRVRGNLRPKSGRTKDIFCVVCLKTRGTLTTTEKRGIGLRTPEWNRFCSCRKPDCGLNRVERARTSSALPGPDATLRDVRLQLLLRLCDAAYASLLTSGGKSTPANTSSKCGICKNAPESSISPKPSTDAVMPFIAATDNNCQKRRVYKSLVDF